MNPAENDPLRPLRVRLVVTNAVVEARLRFLRNVYGILCAQLLVTMITSAVICKLGIVWMNHYRSGVDAAMFVCFSGWLVFAVRSEPLRKFPANYIALLLCTLICSLMIGRLSLAFTLHGILFAVGTTWVILLYMTIIAWMSSTDLTGLRPFVDVAGCAIVMTLLGLPVRTSWIGHFELVNALVYGTYGLLFAFYVVFDAQRMLGGFGGHRISFDIDEVVFAAVSVYLDILGLLVSFLELMGERKFA
eukprot:TRINITY_DN3834_c0_g1_i1.p1 TRINITY_DN3834_c0_g1~~TRINITY_DN3834_c0_g1_i1.p1  ORF type:complete len:247 (+),score=25.11 TRINITY_DN3834_c0_g1_i1:103-843(+)